MTQKLVLDADMNLCSSHKYSTWLQSSLEDTMAENRELLTLAQRQRHTSSTVIQSTYRVPHFFLSPLHPPNSLSLSHTHTHTYIHQMKQISQQMTGDKFTLSQGTHFYKLGTRQFYPPK